MAQIILSGVTIILSAVASSFILSRRQKDNMDASTNKINMEAEAVLVKSSMELITKFQVAIDLHEKQIKELRREIESLKNKEILHNREREELQNKIKELNKDNLRLRSLDNKNSKKINELQEKIKILENKLLNYVNTN